MISRKHVLPVEEGNYAQLTKRNVDVTPHVRAPEIDLDL
jgi:hypothetical protein